MTMLRHALAQVRDPHRFEIEDLLDRKGVVQLDDEIYFDTYGELPELVRRVLSGELTEPDAIKKAIKTWRPDHLRV